MKLWERYGEHGLDSLKILLKSKREKEAGGLGEKGSDSPRPASSRTQSPGVTQSALSASGSGKQKLEVKMPGIPPIPVDSPSPGPDSGADLPPEDTEASVPITTRFATRFAEPAADKDNKTDVTKDPSAPQIAMTKVGTIKKPEIPKSAKSKQSGSPNQRKLKQTAHQRELQR